MVVVKVSNLLTGLFNGVQLFVWSSISVIWTCLEGTHTVYYMHKHLKCGKSKRFKIIFQNIKYGMVVTNWETYVWWLCSKAKPLGCQVFMVKRLVEINMCTQEMKKLNVLLFSFIRMCLFLLVCLHIMLWVIVLTSQNKTQIHVWSQFPILLAQILFLATHYELRSPYRE